MVCDRDDPSFVSPVPVVQRHRVPWGKMGVKLVTSVLPLPWDWECVDPAYFWPLRLGREARRGVVKGLIDDLMLNPPAVDAMVMACRMSFVGHLLDTSALCDTLSAWQSGEPLSFTRHEAHYIVGRAGKMLSAYARERG